MKGVLLVNLGSPNSTDPKDVKKYLGEFLMDERVIDLPYLLRSFLVKGIILNTRPKKSAAAYKKIWWDEGSPLIVLSEQLHQKVQAQLDVPVELAMRYGKPSIKSGIQKLVDQKVNDIVIVPLYPQFAMATTETILVLANELKNEFFPNIKLSSIPAFYNEPSYVNVLSNSIDEFLKGRKWDHILFSYHGVPERHIRKSDVTKSHCKISDNCCKSNKSDAHEYCYRHQCVQTTENVINQLGLDESKVTTTFQSRLGVDPWLQPYTDQTIANFALKGIKNLVVVTPAFVSDCLETLEEIGMEAVEIFEENGGEKLSVIPCLNVREDWVSALSNLIKDKLKEEEKKPERFLTD